MRGYWHNFIATGNPNGAGLPVWPQAKPGAWSPLVIGDPLQIAPGYQAERMGLWHAKWLKESGAPILP